MQKITPDFACNLIVGDTFYFLDEDFFQSYHRQKAKYDGWKFYAVKTSNKMTINKVLVDVIAFSPDWQETRTWPEVWRGFVPREAHVVIEIGRDPDDKKAEWKQFGHDLRDLIQHAIDNGDSEEVIKTRGVQLVWMIDFLDGLFSQEEEVDEEEFNTDDDFEEGFDTEDFYDEGDDD